MNKIEIFLKEYNPKLIIDISGSKNSSLPIIAASILSDEIVYLNNIPNIKDVNVMLELLDFLNINYIFQSNTLIIYPKKHIKTCLQTSLTNKLRGSYYFLGALISKHHKAQINNIGGCNFSERPINYHIKAFKDLGLKVLEKNNFIKIKGHITSSDITLDYPSLGTTVNIILASVKNKYKTTVTINNAATEPEITDLCKFLNSMGANIQGIDTNQLIIKSVKKLKGTNYTIISDRIEAGTFLILGALHKGITLRNANIKHLEALINTLKNIGCTIEENYNLISLIPSKNRSISIEAKPYPNFPTDLAPQLSVLASQLPGFSTISDTVYYDRFTHINELKKLNIDIIKHLNHSFIKGSQKVNYNSTPLICKDLRQGATLILAASLSDKPVTIQNTHYIERGYENLYKKLSKLGFTINEYITNKKE